MLRVCVRKQYRFQGFRIDAKGQIRADELQDCDENDNGRSNAPVIRLHIFRIERNGLGYAIKILSTELDMHMQRDVRRTSIGESVAILLQLHARIRAIAPDSRIGRVLVYRLRVQVRSSIKLVRYKIQRQASISSR
jgi:hypothetical protein